MIYIDQLQTEEWKSKRELILLRDQHQCQLCEMKEPTLTSKELENPFLPFKAWQVERAKYYEFGEKLKQYDHPQLKRYFSKEAPIGKYLNTIYFINVIDWHLQIHHKYYIQDHYAWEYDNDALITYCNFCHKKFHQNNTVSVFIKRNGSIYKETDLTPCERCSGTGYLEEYEYYKGGVCFLCKGNRFRELV